MTLTSSRYGVIYPSPDRSDQADVPYFIAQVVTGLEKSAMYGQGTLASRPASSGGTPGIAGRFYMQTDVTPHVLWYDFGAGWDSVGAIVSGGIGTTQLADGSVTNIKLADGSVTAVKIANGTITSTQIADNTITAAKLVDSLVPTRGAAAVAEALRSLGTGASQAAAGNDARLADQRVPTNNSVDDTKVGVGALSPNRINGTAVVTSDSRLSDQRAPLDNSVSTVKLQDGSVTNAKLAGGITSDKIVGGIPAAPAGCVLGQSAPQNLPFQTLTNLIWDVERYDSGNLHDAVNPTRITVPLTGMYTVSFNVQSQGIDHFRLYKNGAEIHRFVGNNVAQAVQVSLAAGQYLELLAWNGASSTNYATIMDNESPKFSTSRVA